MRCSLLVEGQGATILIDTAPDLREQLLMARVTGIDAVLFTHAHADQVHGIDDLRPIVYRNRRRIDVYGDADTLHYLRTRFGYCFETPPGSDYPPLLIPHEIEPGGPAITLAGGRAAAWAFAVEHGRIRALGYRIGPIGYVPDVSEIPEAGFAVLEGVDLFIVDCLRYAPHPSHAHLERTLKWIARVKPARAILTNLHIDLDYAALAAQLPPGVEPAYDGLVAAVPEPEPVR